MQVVIGIADLQHEPSHYAPLDTQALFGENVTLYEDQEGWGWSSSRATVTSAISPRPRLPRGRRSRPIASRSTGPLSISVLT